MISIRDHVSFAYRPRRLPVLRTSGRGTRLQRRVGRDASTTWDRIPIHRNCETWEWMSSGGLRGLQLRWRAPFRCARRVRLPCTPATQLHGFKQRPRPFSGRGLDVNATVFLPRSQELFTGFWRSRTRSSGHLNEARIRAHPAPPAAESLERLSPQSSAYHGGLTFRFSRIDYCYKDRQSTAMRH